MLARIWTDELLSKSHKVDDCMLERYEQTNYCPKNICKVDDCMLVRIWTDELLSKNSRKVDDCMLERIWTDELLSKNSRKVEIHVSQDMNRRITVQKTVVR